MADACDSSTIMLAAALEKEEKGRAFYEQAASTCTNERCKEVFAGLMADESVHMSRIQRIHAVLTKGGAWTADWKACSIENQDMRKLLRERAAQLGTKVKPDTSDLEAVNVGIEMEQGSISFYAEQLDKATDTLEKEFSTQMIGEERAHLRTLEDLRLFLTDPEAWYIEMEHHVLDGA
jgi:rubrerythrin